MSGPLQKPGEDINGPLQKPKPTTDEWTVTEARRRYKYQSLQRMSGPLQKPGEDINIKAYNG